MLYWTLKAVIFAIMLSWCWFQWKYRKLLRLARGLPTIRPTIPVFGHLLHSAIRHKLDVKGIFKETCIDIPLEAAMRGVQHFCLWIGPTPLIYTLNPDDIKTILTSSKTLEKTFITDYVKFAVGDGLLTASASIWKPTRRHLQPMFHSRNLEHLMPTFNNKSRDLVQRLSNLDCNSCEDVLHAIHPLATFNALELVFGPYFNDRENNIDIKQILSFVSRSFYLWTARAIYFWLHFDILFQFFYWKPLASLKKEAEVFTNPAKKELKQQLKLQIEKENSSKFGDVDRLTMTDAFASLILSNPNFTEEHFLQNVRTIMAGVRDIVHSIDEFNQRSTRIGHSNIRLTFSAAHWLISRSGIDTTSFTLSTCLLLLAMHPDVQEKVYNEVESVLQGSDDDLLMTDIKSLTYTEQVIKETMRLFPIFPATSRTVAQDIKLSFGVIPAGAMVGMSIYGVHMNPEYYPSPFKFNPEHFSIENICKRPAFSYIPFSAGPRNCIGKNYSIMSMKTTLAHVLRQFLLSTDMKLEDIQLTMNIELTIKNGFPIRFQKRKHFNDSIK